MNVSYLFRFLLLVSLPAAASVVVNSPANGTNVTSPVTYSATSSSATCSQGVSAMGIYVNNSLVYSVQANTLNTNIALSPGTYYTVVQEWDKCGGSSYTPITVTVPGAATTQNGVVISSPADNSTVSSPVHVVASAGSPTCSQGVAAMGVYMNNALIYSVQASSLDTNLTLSPGTHYLIIQDWDNCGGSTSAAVTATVPGGSTLNGVAISLPANNDTVTSPVTFAATAGSTTCAKGVAAMGIYVNSTLVYTTDGSALNTQLKIPGGNQHAVVTEWDNCGGALSTPVDIVVQAPIAPTVSVVATPSSILAGATSSLTVKAANATQVTLTGTDGTSYNLSGSGGSQTVSPAVTTTYTVQATGAGGTASASVAVAVGSAAGLQSINHVIFMLQENHSFDSYFGMLNPYRAQNNMSVGADGKTYSVDGIDDKLTSISNLSDEGTAYPPFKFASTCVQDMTASWLESYGDVSRFDFSVNRGINMDGFVHTSENFAKNCSAGGVCSGTFTDFTGRSAMGHYDQGFLNYYYYMASQFALSDRWFSPISTKSIPSRIATFTGGTTHGLAFDPGSNDHLPQLQIPSIFSELSAANVPWKIYYTVTQGACLSSDDCIGSAPAKYPATDFSYLADANRYLYENPTGAACAAPTRASSVVGDASNSFCIDTNHIAPLSTYYTDLTSDTLPSFAFIEAGYGVNDEHPGSGQSILSGQQQVATIVNSLMNSPSWLHSVFFASYDEGGGLYDHVPPVPGHSNDFTNAAVGSAPVSSIPDIASIAVNADSDNPCTPSGGIPTLNCDLVSTADPGAHTGDAAAVQGFAAQLGFRMPNMVISPYVRRHYVSHIPMDHTAIIRFVENRFIGPSAHLTARDAAQPDLLDFFDFQAVPWAVPPTPPTPVSPASLGYDPCTPTKMGP